MFWQDEMVQRCLDAIPDLICVISREDQLLWANAQARRLLNLPSMEDHRETPRGDPGGGPGDVSLGGPGESRECAPVKPPGSVPHVDAGANPAQGPGGVHAGGAFAPRPVYELLTAMGCEEAAQALGMCRQAWELQRTVRTSIRKPLPDGGMQVYDVSFTPLLTSMYKHLYIHKHTNRGEGGQPGVALVVARDISAIQRLENERLLAQERWLQSDKLAAIGQLAAGLAHEIRNPVTALKGFLWLLQRRYGSEEPYLPIMRAELDRIEEIVSALLRLAKPTPPGMNTVHLDQVVRHVLALMETEALLHKVQLRCSVDADLPPVRGNENQLKQVLVNLIQNGIDAAAGHGGEVAVELMRADPDGVRIRIRDNGPGIPPERLQRIGEPFFTTKDKGTGLGLVVSQQIVTAHHGRLQISSEVGAGTLVEVWLPGVAAQLHAEALQTPSQCL
ncbi:MAG: ATP-binding protein [Alicyclobacillus sp.]|nr:ATP-binding protein [Alicyclobacillus sp.]